MWKKLNKYAQQWQVEVNLFLLFSSGMSVQQSMSEKSYWWALMHVVLAALWSWNVLRMTKKKGFRPIT